MVCVCVCGGGGGVDGWGVAAYVEKYLSKVRKYHNHTGFVAKNPVFGISEKASFKPVSAAIETS